MVFKKKKKLSINKYLNAVDKNIINLGYVSRTWPILKQTNASLRRLDCPLVADLSQAGPDSVLRPSKSSFKKCKQWLEMGLKSWTYFQGLNICSCRKVCLRCSNDVPQVVQGGVSIFFCLASPPHSGRWFFPTFEVFHSASHDNLPLLNKTLIDCLR